MIAYGTTEESSVIDASGSTITTIIHHRDGTAQYPRFRRTKLRIKVKDKGQEMQEYLDFSDFRETPGIIDPAFRIEHTKHGDANGYYYVVKEWTERIDEATQDTQEA